MFGALVWPVVLVFQLSGFLFRIRSLVGSTTMGCLQRLRSLWVSGFQFLIRRGGRRYEGRAARVMPAQAPTFPQAGVDPAWRFSLLSAILTGLSLVLTAVFAVINVSVNASRMPGQDPYMITGTPFFLFGLPAAITAITGFILGASALGEIRKSGGTKDGLGFAIFAVVVWPIVVMAVLIQLSLSTPMPGSGGSGIPTSLAVLLAGISLLLASFVLIRGLRRWARGVEKKDGQRQFPGLTGTVLATLGLAILGPVLAAVVPSVFTSTDRRAHSRSRAGNPADEGDDTVDGDPLRIGR